MADLKPGTAVALLTRAGLDLATLRLAALSILGALADLPPIRMPRCHRPARWTGLPSRWHDLDPRAWQVLCWRQQHLPLRRLRRHAHYEALWQLESRAAQPAAGARARARHVLAVIATG